MIKKNNTISYETTSPCCLVSHILNEYSDYYLTKEDIYDKVPRLPEDNEPIITISLLETTLKNMRMIGEIDCMYIKNRAHYTIRHRQ